MKASRASARRCESGRRSCGPVHAAGQVAQNAVNEARSQSRWCIGPSRDVIDHHCRKARDGRPIETQVAPPALLAKFPGRPQQVDEIGLVRRRSPPCPLARKVKGGSVSKRAWRASAPPSVARSNITATASSQLRHSLPRGRCRPLESVDRNEARTLGLQPAVRHPVGAARCHQGQLGA